MHTTLTKIKNVMSMNMFWFYFYYNLWAHENLAIGSTLVCQLYVPREEHISLLIGFPQITSWFCCVAFIKANAKFTQSYPIVSLVENVNVNVRSCSYGCVMMMICTAHFYTSCNMYKNLQVYKLHSHSSARRTYKHSEIVRI